MKLHQELDPAEGVPVGRDPRTMTVADLEALGHHKRPLLSAIRQNCIDCCAGSPAEVRRCGMVACPMWPYRMGANPFAERTMTDEQRAAATARLHAARQHARSAGNSPIAQAIPDADALVA